MSLDLTCSVRESGASEIRNPKPENRKKPEIRGPNSPAAVLAGEGRAAGNLSRPSLSEGQEQADTSYDRSAAASDFGFRPSFGPRISDFGSRREARLSRRDFIARTALASSAMALCGAGAFPAVAAEQWPPSVVVFSKIYQDLKLNFEDAAALTADAGMDGIDCPVRPSGEILPEHAVEQLPQYADVLKKRGLQMPFITTGITSAASPHAEEILRTAKKLGVKFYRLGFTNKQADAPPGKQVSEVRAKLKDLVPLNKELGLGAVLENHSSSGRGLVGGDLNEMCEVVQGFDPSQIGVAFDVGHAIIAHGDDWRRHFDQLKSYIKVAYVKDIKRGKGFVHFGEGELGSNGYFKLLKEKGYRAPVCLHIEFDWSDKGKSKTRAALLQALQESTQVLRRWLAQA
jgi:L-ribulose-5-phosphate 3-epimerase